MIGSTDTAKFTIDHVELQVPNRFDAAKWYGEMFGFEILENFRFWSDDPRGPLMVSTDGGATKLALFDGEQEGTRRGVGFHRVAFRVSGATFLAFLERHPVYQGDVHDHREAFSVYFDDPYGNALEVTSYEHRQIRDGLAQASHANS